MESINPKKLTLVTAASVAIAAPALLYAVSVFAPSTATVPFRAPEIAAAQPACAGAACFRDMPAGVPTGLTVAQAERTWAPEPPQAVAQVVATAAAEEPPAAAAASCDGCAVEPLPEPAPTVTPPAPVAGPETTIPTPAPEAPTTPPTTAPPAESPTPSTGGCVSPGTPCGSSSGAAEQDDAASEDSRPGAGRGREDQKATPKQGAKGKAGEQQGRR